jgi:hypothetical protein
MRNMHAKFHEFIMHQDDDMNLSLIFEYMIIKILFKGFQINLFYIFLICNLFVMNFQIS